MRICLLHAARLLALLAAMLPGVARAEPGLPILVYHQLRTTEDGPADGPTAISLGRFEAQMRTLHEQGYRTLRNEEVVEFIAGRADFPDKVVAIHFDDGWKSALNALPVLSRYGFNAAFWIIPGKGIGWPHMDWNEVQLIAADPLREVLSHTMTHPWQDGDTLPDWVQGRVPGKGPEQVRWELAESRRLLEEKLGRPVDALAWPRGLYDENLIRLAGDVGYRTLYTIDDGLNRPGQDRLRIRRTMVHGACGDAMFVRILADGQYRDCPPGD